MLGRERGTILRSQLTRRRRAFAAILALFVFVCLPVRPAAAQSETAPDYFVTWTDDRDGNGVNQVYMHGYRSDGSSAISERAANAVAKGQQLGQSVAMDGKGNSVVVWMDDQDGNGSFEILARGFGPDGSQRIPQFTVNTDSAGQQFLPDIAMDSDGNFAVVWMDDPTGNFKFERIMMRAFYADGSARSKSMNVSNTSEGNHLAPAVATNGCDIAIVWQDDTDDNDFYEIRARSYSPSDCDSDDALATLVYDLHVNSESSGQQKLPDVAMDRDGNFVVVWEDDSDGNDTYQIYARGFDRLGRERIHDWTVNSEASGQQLKPAIAMDFEGNFVVAWQDDLDGNDVYQIRARGFDAAGAERFRDFTVNTVAAGQQKEPAIAMDGDGNFIIAWQSNADDAWEDDVDARGFYANGRQRLQSFSPNGNRSGKQVSPAVAMRSLTRVYLPTVMDAK